MRFKHPSGQLARWLMELGQYAFQIEHRSGTKHLNADGMSRIPVESACDCYVAGEDVESLPCRGCEYCRRVHSQWARFEDEVDDVVPITVRHRTPMSERKDDLDLTDLWTEMHEGKVQGHSHRHGGMQSGALAQACVQPDGGRVVRAIQTESVTTGDARTDGGQISNYMEPTVSVSREMLGKQLAAYWRGTVENVATPSPCDVAAVLHWRVMMRLLAELPEEARAQVRQAPLLGDAEGEMLRSMAIDGHCHLELMRRRFSLNRTLESLLGTLAVNHASPVMSGLEAVVTNAVFREEWDTTMPDFIRDIRVLKTWGVHPKAVRDVNWQWIERKMASPECIAVGECGLDETARDMTLQEEVFNRQVRIAQRLDKPLILHLRGLNARTTSALYGRALALVTPVLKKRHKIYLHSFSAGLAEFQLWYRFFSNLLVGCSWLTTSDFSRMDLLRVLPTTVIALETDSPHLSSRVGVVNSPYRV